MSELPKIGIAGAGVFGGHHARKFASSDQCELVGIFDLNLENAATLAGQLDVVVFPTFEALIDAVDGVVVATPATTHFDLAKKALVAGRDVFIEKPMACSAREASELASVAEQNDCVFQLGLQERYVAEAVGLFDLKMPGAIHCVRHSKPSDRCNDVSVVLDLMIHDLDIVREITGAKSFDLESAAGDWDCVCVRGVLDTGQSVTLSASRNTNDLSRTITFQYDTGELAFDFATKEFSANPAGSVNAPRRRDGSDALADPLGFGDACFVSAMRDRSSPRINAATGKVTIEWASKIEMTAGVSERSDLVLDEV